MPRFTPPAPGRRLAACAGHLRLLAAAVERLDRDSRAWTHVAFELRVLVAGGEPGPALLLDLMDEFGVTYDIGMPPDHPAPIRLVDAGHDGAGAGRPAEEAHHPTPARRLPLRRFVALATAVYLPPREYSYHDLILAAAADGGAGVTWLPPDAGLDDLTAAVEADGAGVCAPLAALGRHVLAAGDRLLARASRPTRYPRRPRPSDGPDPTAPADPSPSP